MWSLGAGWDWWVWGLLVAGAIGFWVLVAGAVAALLRGEPVARRSRTLR